MKNIIKDITGKVVTIGDMVAFNVPKYKRLGKGKVLRVTPKGIRVEYFDIRYSKMDTTFIATEQFVIIEADPKPQVKELPVCLGQKVFTKERGNIRIWEVYAITLCEHSFFLIKNYRDKDNFETREILFDDIGVHVFLTEQDLEI